MSAPRSAVATNAAGNSATVASMLSAGMSAMTQPPNPPPVIRAPSAPSDSSDSAVRSTSGTVMRKSSRIEACDAVSSGPMSDSRPASRSSTVSSTRAFSVTT